MGDVQLVGYHTCSRDNGIDFIKSSAPFYCNPKRKHWLTEGYYFWTDSDYFAHKWGEDSYDGNYAIMKCLIVIDKALLLDLVGNVEDRLYFEMLTKKFSSYVAKPEVQGRFPADAREKSPTVRAVIAFWRKQRDKLADKKIFPYVAIKAQEVPRSSNMRFVEGRNERLLGVTRQQLCLFREAYESIEQKELVHPVNI